MSAMLASVRSIDEARIALAGGADLIDLKEPARGALGALDRDTVRAALRAIAGQRPVSATIGDLAPTDPEALAEAARRMAATGVDYVKIGFFPDGRALACLRALAPLAREAPLVAVLFADETIDLSLVDEIARAGFAGAMLDTAKKSGGSLRARQDDARLGAFVRRARGLGLLTGLAGSLGEEDVAPLLALGPDYLGFRGALCRRGERTDMLDRQAFAGIRALIARRGAESLARAPGAV